MNFLNVLKFLPVVILFSACKPDLDVPVPSAGDANFTKMVAVGGDFMAGYQDGALCKAGQDHSIPALLAHQMTFAGGRDYIQLTVPGGASVGWNAKPWESWFVTASHLNYKTDCEGVNSLMPIWDSVSRGTASAYFTNAFSTEYCNYAVPFATIQELFSPALGNYTASQNTNPFYHWMASNPGVSTVIKDARNTTATFFSAWLGMEDIYNYASGGGAGMTIASSATFSSYLDSVFMALTANGAKGVVANIPDFRNFPFYTLVPWNGAALTQNKADSLTNIYATAGLTNINFVEGANGFVLTDANAPNGYRQMHSGEYITLGVPLDSLKCDYLGILFTTMPDRYVLDSAEVSFLDQQIAAYNAVIEQKAAQYGLAMFDANSYFRNVTAGIKWNGVDFNSEFVTGGFFSLDGYHPNQNGYALLANKFIEAINLKYHASVPPVNCTDCNGILFP
jgi:hypothetical protein